MKKLEKTAVFKDSKYIEIPHTYHKQMDDLIMSHHPCHHQTSIRAAFYFWFLGGQELLIIADEDLAELQTSHDRHLRKVVVLPTEYEAAISNFKPAISHYNMKC